MLSGVGENGGRLTFSRTFAVRHVIGDSGPSGGAAMSEVRTYRWLPASGKRHAVPGGRATPGEEITTLVGERVTVPTQRLGSTEWTWPTCRDCYDEAKKCTHISLAALAVRH